VDRVLVRVRDEGPGVSVAEQARLFQHGVRLSAQPTGGEPSSGYGLAVAKQLVEQLGGTIACESPPGQGATFTVSLPG
jgi:two-component system, sensor histidine kinase LadS